jgi:hypothetical protein
VTSYLTPPKAEDMELIINISILEYRGLLWKAEVQMEYEYWELNLLSKIRIF